MWSRSITTCSPSSTNIALCRSGTTTFQVCFSFPVLSDKSLTLTYPKMITKAFTCMGKSRFCETAREHLKYPCCLQRAISIPEYSPSRTRTPNSQQSERGCVHGVLTVPYIWNMINCVFPVFVYYLKQITISHSTEWEIEIPTWRLGALFKLFSQRNHTDFENHPRTRGLYLRRTLQDMTRCHR
jgi:hypothetical protein